MKQLRKFLSLTLAVLMLISVLPTGAMAEEAETDSVITEESTTLAGTKASGTCGDKLTWTLNDAGTLTISGTGAMTDYSWNYIFQNNQFVTVASHPWRIWADSINKIVIEKGVTSIGDLAFYDLRKVTDVSISGTVTAIGSSAFQKCEGLTTVTVPGSVKTLEDSAFAECKSLKSATLSDGVATIGYNAFGFCGSLTKISIPNTVKTIGNSAFVSCSSLAEIILPSGLTEISSATFQYCSSLKSVSIPDTVTRIEGMAFQDCTALTDITIPASVTSIGHTEDGSPMNGTTFAGCTALATIDFKGSAPAFVGDVFWSVTAKAYYPANDTSWTSSVKQNYGGNITWVGLDPDCPIPSKPYKITNVVSGVHVYWNKIDGVSKYGVWRSETGVNGTYKWIANPAVPHFTDTTVKSGKTYYYRITSISPSTGKHSEKSQALGITYISTPDITSRANTSQGIQLGWNKITGATGYAIYRKVGANDWTRVATIDGNATFTWVDTAVKSGNGTTYKYTIRALYGKTLSGCRNTGRTMVRLFTPTISSCAPHATISGCAFLRWNENNRATGYEVRFLLNGKVVKTFTVGNNQTVARRFEGLQADNTYTVQVRSYYKTASAGTYYSAWSTAKNVAL